MGFQRGFSAALELTIKTGFSARQQCVRSYAFNSNHAPLPWMPSGCTGYSFLACPLMRLVRALLPSAPGAGISPASCKTSSARAKSKPFNASRRPSAVNQNTRPVWSSSHQPTRSRTTAARGSSVLFASENRLSPWRSIKPVRRSAICPFSALPAALSRRPSQAANPTSAARVASPGAQPVTP